MIKVISSSVVCLPGIYTGVFVYNQALSFDSLFAAANPERW